METFPFSWNENSCLSFVPFNWATWLKVWPYHLPLCPSSLHIGKMKKTLDMSAISMSSVTVCPIPFSHGPVFSLAILYCLATCRILSCFASCPLSDLILAGRLLTLSLYKRTVFLCIFCMTWPDIHFLYVSLLSLDFFKELLAYLWRLPAILALTQQGGPFLSLQELIPENHLFLNLLLSRTISCRSLPSRSLFLQKFSGVVHLPASRYQFLNYLRKTGLPCTPLNIIQH